MHNLNHTEYTEVATDVWMYCMKWDSIIITWYILYCHKIIIIDADNSVKRAVTAQCCNKNMSAASAIFLVTF